MAAFTTIDDPEAYFQVKLYTGNGGSQSITLDGDTDMQPDLIWIKERDDAHSSSVIDSVRGVRKTLTSDETASVITESSGLSAFDSDGFSFDGAGGNHVNVSDQPTVAWCWKESATAGFDIVTYTGNAAQGRDLSHSLSAVPHVMIVKNRTNSIKWAIYHHKNTSAPATDHLILDSNAATADDDSTWNDTDPTSSVFTVKSSTSVNGSSADYVAYLWTEKQGFNSMGSYVGNGSTNGTAVHTGFRPAFLMIKRTDSTGNWFMFDNKRSTFNEIDGDYLEADLPSAEVTTSTAVDLDFLSNGFKIRNTSSSYNANDGTYVYFSWAESPFVNSNGVPNNAR